MWTRCKCLFSHSGGCDTLGRGEMAAGRGGAAALPAWPGQAGGACGAGMGSAGAASAQLGSRSPALRPPFPLQASSLECLRRPKLSWTSQWDFAKIQVKPEFNKDLQNLPCLSFFQLPKAYFPKACQPPSRPHDVSPGVGKGLLGDYKKMGFIHRNAPSPICNSRLTSKETVVSGDEKVKREAKRESKVQSCLKPAGLLRSK